MSAVGPLRVDVRVGARLSNVVLVPRQSEHRSLVLRALRQGGIDAKADAGGVCVDAMDAPRLFDLDTPLSLTWSEDAHRFALNRAHVREHAAAVRSRVRGLLEIDEIPEDLGVDATTLDDHQRRNVAAMTVPAASGLCVFDEQGAGKTVTLIFAFDLLVHRDEIDFALILAPKSMVPEWPRDFERFRPGLHKVVVASGGRAAKAAALRSGADVVVTNFETAVTMEEELRALLRTCDGRAVLAVDESFYVKNLDARRTRAIRRLREWCSRAFVLCGTPAPNSPHDLVEQFNLTDFGMTFAGVDIPKDRSDAAPVVRAAIEARGTYVRHLKRDVLPQLPRKSFQRCLVPLEPVQRAVYTSVLNNLILDLEATDAEAFRRQLPNFLARRTALLQVCSSPALVTDGYTETPAKLLALDRLLEDLVARGEKVVVWSFFTSSVAAIVERYARFNPVRYDGTVADVEERRDAVRRFQEDHETMIFVGNPAAAGAGLTLHRARYAVYESLSNQAAHYLQSLDRIHRRGQAREVEYVVLLCDGTIEVKEYDRLIDKERAAQELLGDGATAPLTREVMLHELVEANRLLQQESAGAE